MPVKAVFGAIKRHRGPRADLCIDNRVRLILLARRNLFDNKELHPLVMLSAAKHLA